MVQPAVKKTGTEHKLQAATERKQQVAGKKAAFARSDSLKADEAATKQKLKQAIKPAVMKTAQDRKLEEAQWRKKESSNKKAAFARSDSLKSDEIYAKNKVQECIRPAVAKAAIDDKAIDPRRSSPLHYLWKILCILAGIWYDMIPRLRQLVAGRLASRQRKRRLPARTA